jgi:hypothetical protein
MFCLAAIGKLARINLKLKIERTQIASLIVSITAFHTVGEAVYS